MKCVEMTNREKLMNRSMRNPIIGKEISYMMCGLNIAD